MPLITKPLKKGMRTRCAIPQFSSPYEAVNSPSCVRFRTSKRPPRLGILTNLFSLQISLSSSTEHTNNVGFFPGPSDSAYIGPIHVNKNSRLAQLRCDTHTILFMILTMRHSVQGIANHRIAARVRDWSSHGALMYEFDDNI